MTEKLEYRSPRSFTWRQKVVLAVVPFLAGLLWKALIATCRIEYRGRENFERLLAENGLALGGFWHEGIGLAASTQQGIDGHTLTSYSFDGELAARFARQFGFRSVRGSSSRGSVRALQQIELAAQNSTGIAFTLDGPKGPRRIAKPGIAYVAARMQHPVVPGALIATRSWRLNSWDRFQIPKPFSTIICHYGEPVEPPNTIEAEAARKMAQQLTERLNAMQRALETEFGIDPKLDGNQ